MAQQLRRKGKEVALLALFDMDAGVGERPSLEQIEKVDDAELLAFVLEEYLPLNAGRLRQMTPDQQLLYVLEEAKPANIFPPGFGLDHLRRLLRVYKATARAWVLYQPQAYDGKIALFRAGDQKIYKGSDETMGWNEVAPQRVEVYRIPGDHISIFREPQVRVLARRLGACISAVTNKS
jgi:thioesterase domain-containing protein